MLIYSYDNKSSSVRLLADALGAKLIRHENSTLKRDPKNIILCWGKAPDDIWKYGRVWNHPNAVYKAIHKAVAFDWMKAAGVSVPAYSRKRENALKWQKEGKTVVCRTTTTGKDGEGTSVVKPGEPMPDAKLYTELVSKKAEYRVHVVDGKVVDGMRKLRENGKPVHPISTTSNGYFFQKTGVVTPERVKSEAIKAVAALGLDYGGVDVIEQEDGTPVVLEVNSAFELGTNTVRNVAEAIKAMVARVAPART